LGPARFASERFARGRKIVLCVSVIRERWGEDDEINTTSCRDRRSVKRIEKSGYSVAAQVFGSCMVDYCREKVFVPFVWGFVVKK